MKRLGFVLAVLRSARSFTAYNVRIRLIGHVFNVFNTSTTLLRNNNIGAPTFNQIAQNLSPSILRFGLVVGF